MNYLMKTVKDGFTNYYFVVDDFVVIIPLLQICAVQYKRERVHDDIYLKREKQTKEQGISELLLSNLNILFINSLQQSMSFIQHSTIRYIITNKGLLTATAWSFAWVSIYQFYHDLSLARWINSQWPRTPKYTNNVRYPIESILLANEPFSSSPEWIYIQHTAACWVLLNSVNCYSRDEARWIYRGDSCLASPLLSPDIRQPRFTGAGRY